MGLDTRGTVPHVLVQAPGSSHPGLSPSSGSSGFVLVSLFLRKQSFIYLSVLGLSRGTQDLPCITRAHALHLEGSVLRHTGFIAPQHVGS